MITQLELRAFLSSQFQVFNELVLDSHYSLPSRDWVLNTWGPAFKRNLELLGMTVYRDESNDCDDFALANMALARLAHHLTPGAGKSTLAFGYMVYSIKANSLHAINFAVVRELGALKLLFIEPQNQTELVLTPWQLSNVETTMI